MKEDVLSGQWRQIRGTLKSWWGKLSDDDIDRIGGQKDKLIGYVQERYGHTREQAEREVEQRLSEFGQGGAGGVASGLKQRADDFGQAVTQRAGEAASKLTGGFESARNYLGDTDVDEMAGELASLVRRYPIHACLVGIGLGYLIARSIIGTCSRRHLD